MTRSPEVPREGILVPAFELPRSGGGAVRLRAYRGRRGLALIFTHGPGCDRCRAYLGGALAVYDAYADAGAEVIAVVPGDAESVAAMRHDLALPFPLAVDESGASFRRYALSASEDAAVMATDRYGEPRLWRTASPDHILPEHEAVIAELRYLSLTCSGGGPTLLWPEP